MKKIVNVKKQLQNKKGAADIITLVPIVIVCISLMMFFIDLTSYAQKYLAVRKAKENLTEIICSQGQVSPGVPSNFPGNGDIEKDVEYWKNSEIQEYTRDMFNQAGIPNFTVSVTFDKLFKSSNPPLTVDLMSLPTTGTTSILADNDSDITVDIDYTFTWVTGNTSRVHLSRVGGTEYMHRSEDWSARP